MRYKILEKTTTENGIDIYDPTSIKWNKFVFTNSYKKHIISASEIYKPYLISYNYYGSVDYDDIILLINGIDDIFNFEPGTEIKIPAIQDIEQFILDNKK
jgi:hypothetical protein